MSNWLETIKFLKKFTTNVHPLARWTGLGLGAIFILGIMVAIFWRAPTSMEEESNKITFLQIGTGPSDGPYFAWGGRLAAVVSRPPDTGRCEPGGPCGVDGVLAVVKSSSGSVANVRAVATRHIQSALVQSLVLKQARLGTGPFRGEKPIRSLRAIANIRAENIYLVAGRGASIVTPADLVGKRLALGVKGSSTESVGLVLLQGYGIARKNVEITYAEPEDAADLLLRNQLDAFIYVASNSSPFLTNLANRGVIDIIPIAGDKAAAILKSHPELTSTHVSGGTYRFVPAIDTLAVGVVWVCDESADDRLVHSLTEALFYPGNRDLLPMTQTSIYGPVKRNDKKFAEVRRELMQQATDHLPIPLHHGAAEFYRQENVPDTLTPH